MLKQDYPGFGLTYFYVYSFNSSSSTWNKDNLFISEVYNQWEFHKVRFDLKGNFSVELADTLDSTKSVSIDSEIIK